VNISMASVSNSVAVGLPSYGLYAGAKFLSQGYRNFPRKSSYKYLRIRAVQGNDGRRRLVDIIRIIPELSRDYFRSRSRRALFGGIALLGGFYVAQTISLSFGALGVNDVIAAVVCVLLAEYVTKFYYSRPKVTFPIALHSSTISRWVSHMAYLLMPSNLLAELQRVLLGCFSVHSWSRQT